MGLKGVMHFEGKTYLVELPIKTKILLACNAKVGKLKLHQVKVNVVKPKFNGNHLVLTLFIYRHYRRVVSTNVRY